jgi:prepilin-type N-terminal cleavage/methylation domain-containing protein
MIGSRRGFTIMELVVVVAIIGIITAIGTPVFLRFMQASTLRAGAEEMAAVLNSARQLAIKENTTVCVTNDGTKMQYHVGGCANAAWTGAGTDASGFIRLANNVKVSPAGTSVIFTYLGAASTAGTLTVTNPQDSKILHVIVAATGRVSIGP